MNRVLYIDLLRITAIVSVIILHSAAKFLYEFNTIKITEWQIANFFDSAVRFCVPLFFMISGVLFLKMKEEKLKEFFKKRFLKIFIPLLIWSFFLYLLSTFIIFEGTYLLSKINGEFDDFFYIYTSFPVFIQASSVFIIIRYLGEYLEKKDIKQSKIYKLVLLMSITSFGIYLIHPIVQWIFEKIIKEFMNNVSLYILLLFVFTYIFSFIIVFLLQKIYILKRIVP